MSPRLIIEPNNGSEGTQLALWNPSGQFVFNTLGIKYISLWAVISFPYDPPDPSLSCILNEYLIFNMLTVRKVVLCKRLSFSFQAIRKNCAFERNGDRGRKEVRKRQKCMIRFLGLHLIGGKRRSCQTVQNNITANNWTYKVQCS